jgi:type VI secretion system protein ImpH
MDLIAGLLADPQRFEFAQAVRLLVLALGERGIAPDAALRRHLRFANSLSLRFPASQLEAATEDAAASTYCLTPTFMGLSGVHGALPLHVTERLQAGAGAVEPDGARAFLDLFSSRMLTLWYGAWRKYRIEHAVAAPHDAFMPLLLALAGFAGDGSRAGRAGVPDAALAAYAGMLRRRPASAAVLSRVLSSHFGVTVLVQEGIGHWNRLAPDEQSALGANAQLGRAAMLGARSWRPDLRVRVHIGPLDRLQFERFLPQAAAAQALRTLLGLFASPTLAYDIVLVLRRAAAGPTQLAAPGRRLGLDSYLLDGPAASDRADLHYELRPLAPLPPLPPPRVSRA